MSDFSLVGLIRRVIEETDFANPEDIASKVAEMVPPKQLRAALAEALPHIVRIELTRHRASATTVRRVPNPSSKVAAIRGHLDAWRKRLRDRISVGPSDWKLLADCTAVDFRAAAGQRRAMPTRLALAAGTARRAATPAIPLARTVPLPLESPPVVVRASRPTGRRRPRPARTSSPSPA